MQLHSCTLVRSSSLPVDWKVPMYKFQCHYVSVRMYLDVMGRIVLSRRIRYHVILVTIYLP